MSVIIANRAAWAPATMPVVSSTTTGRPVASGERSSRPLAQSGVIGARHRWAGAKSSPASGSM